MERKKRRKFVEKISEVFFDRWFPIGATIVARIMKISQ
jgi:hypothetical protein